MERLRRTVCGEEHVRSNKPIRRFSGEGPGPASLERTAFFSDAVFAIAITLLSLEIQLPAVGGPLTNANCLEIWPKYLAYGISFLVIGLFWIGHHRKFSIIKRYDGNLLLLNLLMLMAIAFTPFPTALLTIAARMKMYYTTIKQTGI